MKQDAIIPIHGGYSALVDMDDYSLLSARRWYLSPQGYAVCNAKPKQQLMHRVVTRAQKGVHVDHINGNKLDNRKCNLRFASQSQNLCNRSAAARNTSGFKGVSVHRCTGKWQARIQFQGKAKFLGCFVSASEAHAAYCVAAKDMHGAFAKTI